MSLTKCTVQRCHGQPSTRAIAALSPSWSSETASRTPPMPRFLRPRRNSTQKAPDSTSPTSRPITSRRPGLVHRIRDDERLGDDPPLVSHLDLLGIEPQVRVRAVERPLAERLHLLIQGSAERGDTVFGHPLDPQLLD